MIKQLRFVLLRIPRELILFACVTFAMGVAYSIFDATFNNFLNERFTLSPFQRSFLELPRELPGFLVVFVSAALWFLNNRKLGAVCMLMGMAGVLLIGFVSPSYAMMLAWLFIFSMGQHLFMPIASTIGMELSSAGRTGRRLGQLNALRNGATITGSFLVVLGFRYFDFDFNNSFLIAALGLAVAAGLMFAMRSVPTQQAQTYLQLHRRYRLYYALSVVSGVRKQLFITFAPWVLVTVFNQPTQIIATLLMIGGIIGILFQPLLGWSIDRYGERLVLVSEAFVLIFVCFGYGYAKFLFPVNIAFYIVCGCYLLDQMMISVSMARSTYMKKIAVQNDHIQPALTAGVTIDHIFSISAALLGGLVWNTFGYQYVFLVGVFIAAISLVVALQVRIPVRNLTPEPAV